jgi:hypothetical protein
MVPRGLLLPVEGGFEVYLRDMVAGELDISCPEPQGVLSGRQRFSFAHEIAHTLFYDLSASVPCPQDTIENGFALEKLCNETAGYILVPTELLKRELEDYELIDADFVRSVAARFNVSLIVAIERLCAVQPSNPFERCVVLAKRIEGDAEIRALYCGIGLLSTLPRPVKFSRVTDWVADFPRQFIEMRNDGEWKTTRMGGPSDAFLLQAEVARSAEF